MVSPGVFRPDKVVSGGQTGVDRAALDTAIALGIPHGGWCPKGRLAEDGAMDPRYQLCETDSAQYAIRTEWNVRDSDATLILCRGKPTGGTRLTQRLARRHHRPCLVVDLLQPVDFEAVRQWLVDAHPAVLNVAGPRESQSPGIAAEVATLLRRLFTEQAIPR